MRKIGITLAPLFILALAFSAFAQEKPITTLKDRADTVKVTVSGAVVLDYVWRSGPLAAYTTDIESTPAVPRDENTFEGELGIQLDIELSDKVNAVVQIGRERVDANTFIVFTGNGQVDWQEIVIREMRVNINEFLTPQLSMQVGIPTWSFDVRGKGNSFAFDPRHAQSATRNAGTTQDVTGTLGARGGAPDELDPMGAVLTYKMDALTLDLVFLPMVIEGGPPSEDEALYAVDLWYNLEQVGKGSRVGGILALGSGADHPTSVFTIGGGAVLKELVPGLEIYGEVYFQFGDAGKNALGDDADAAGLALQVGAQFNFESDLAPWIGANITMISGDGDDTIDDTDVDRFLGYENINDLIIIEDMCFGLDWDTNCFAIERSGGLAFSVGGGKNNIELSAILGITRTMEDVYFGVAVGGEDALGTEFDARMKWHITKQASLNAAVGFLFGSDILEESMGGSANDNSEDNAMMYTVGADLKF